MFQVSRSYRAVLLGALLLSFPSHFLFAQTVLATVTTGNKPGAIAVNETTNKVYVINASDSDLAVIDGATNGTTNITGLANPYVLAVNASTNKIYVANSTGGINGGGVVTAIDGTTLSTTNINIGKGVSAIAVNATTNKIYAANSLDSTVSVIDGITKAVTTLSSGSNPLAIGVNATTNKIYVVNYFGNSVTVIDGATNATSTVSVGTFPFKVAVNPVTNKIYVLNSVTNLQMTVTVIDGATNGTSAIVLGNTSDGTPGSQDITVDTGNNKVYVSAGTDSSNLGRLNVIDGATKTVTAKLTVGYKPMVVVANPKTHKIYTANDGGNNVSVVDGATNTVSTLTVGSDPQHMAINTTTGRVYVANQGSGTVSVIGVAAIGTTTTVTSDVNPQYAGTNVTFTAYVAPKTGSAIPRGNVTFSVDGWNASTVALDGTGHAMFATNTLSVGSHTVKASYAGNTNFLASNGSMTETIEAVATAAPVFTPAPGTYYAAQGVTISDATPGAVIYYTLDGGMPSTASLKYTAPISIAKTTTLKAIAVASGYTASAISSGVYTILPPLAATPTFGVKPATYTSTRWVGLADTTPGAIIYYTIDGTTPTTASAQFTDLITVPATTTIKAIAVATGYSNSPVATGVFTIRAPGWAPTFSLATGGYAGSQTVRIGDITPGATIYYTTDGTAPTTASAKYIKPLTVTVTTTVKAFATSAGYANSPIAAATYTIK